MIKHMEGSERNKVSRELCNNIQLWQGAISHLTPSFVVDIEYRYHTNANEMSLYAMIDLGSP
jgi:hypothetical protein